MPQEKRRPIEKKKGREREGYDSLPPANRVSGRRIDLLRCCQSAGARNRKRELFEAGERRPKVSWRQPPAKIIVVPVSDTLSSLFFRVLLTDWLSFRRLRALYVYLSRRSGRQCFNGPTHSVLSAPSRGLAGRFPQPTGT